MKNWNGEDPRNRSGSMKRTYNLINILLKSTLFLYSLHAKGSGSKKWPKISWFRATFLRMRWISLQCLNTYFSDTSINLGGFFCFVFKIKKWHYFSVLIPLKPLVTHPFSHIGYMKWKGLTLLQCLGESKGLPMACGSYKNSEHTQYFQSPIHKCI